MKKCPLFGKCGGCKYDFASDDYKKQKLSCLSGLSITEKPVWIEVGTRRRADFAFAEGNFGFYEKRSKNIIPVKSCPLLMKEINDILPNIAGLSWNGSGACLVTLCDNGIDVSITSNTPYFSSEFKKSVEKLDVIRIAWNGIVIKQKQIPLISFDGIVFEYPIGAFLQPTKNGEKKLRDMVIAATKGSTKIVDLFCGLGNFALPLKADGFDIVGYGVKRDLFKKPLTAGMLEKYNCVVMDPPRSGALAQCQELVKSKVNKIIYVSCNPETFKRDSDVLIRGGYNLNTLCPVDQFVGSSHWELFSVFLK